MDLEPLAELITENETSEAKVIEFTYNLNKIFFSCSEI
jgi:hypothetical protein